MNIITDIDEIKDVNNDIPNYSTPNRSCTIKLNLTSNETDLSDELLQKSYVSNNNNLKISDRKASQKEIELELLEKNTCAKLNPEIYNNFLTNVDSINIGKVSRELSGAKSLISSYHDNLSCYVDSIIHKENTPGKNTPNMRERVKDWITDISKIGKESVEGYVFKTNIDNNDSLFVMKAPRDPSNDNLYHEAFVGTFALNKIRKYVPNFMYVYGYFTCSAPVINGKETVTWCSSNSKRDVTYLILENIKDGKSFGDWISQSDISRREFIEVFVQLINALNIATDGCGFTHYDLHEGNVMIRKFDRKVAIPFIETKTEAPEILGYITSNFVPYVIDYGYSRISLQNNGKEMISYGKIGLEFAGVDITRAYPMYDIYKLLCFLGEKMYRTVLSGRRVNDEIFDLLDKFYQFFNENPRDNINLLNRVKQRINDKTDFYNLLDNTPDKFYENSHYSKFINFVLDIIEFDFSFRTENYLERNNIYDDYLTKDVSNCQFIDKFRGTGPKTSIEYCELLANVKDKNLMPKVNIDVLVNNDKTDIVNNFDEMSMLFKNTSDMIRIRDRDIKLLVENNIYILYKKIMLNILRIKELLVLIRQKIKAITCISTTNNVFLNEAMRNVNDAIVMYNSRIRMLINNDMIIKNVVWNNITNNEDTITFWKVEYKLLFNAI